MEDLKRFLDEVTPGELTLLTLAMAFAFASFGSTLAALTVWGPK